MTTVNVDRLAELAEPDFGNCMHPGNGLGSDRSVETCVRCQARRALRALGLLEQALAMRPLPRCARCGDSFNPEVSGSERYCTETCGEEEG